MDFETLDAIADAYIPLLAIIFFIGLTVSAVMVLKDRQFLRRVFVFFASLLGIAYGFMFLDNTFHLWPYVNLDYSTHTAVSLTLVIANCLLARQFWKLIISSFILYVLLMLYQKYHTVLDIFSTAIPIVLIALVLIKLLSLREKNEALLK